MPCCLKKQEDGCYVVLNREYKPIGFRTKDWIDYEIYPISHKFTGIGPSTAKKLSWSGSDNTDEIFLYNDGCIPDRSAENMKSYLKKIEILMELKIKS
jgi:hypothetical protein